MSQNIIEEEGEGIIMRMVGSIYQNGRNPALVKLKSSQSDKEAMVTNIAKKTVHLKLPHGTTFTVEEKDVMVPGLKVGDIVTFSFSLASRRDIPSNVKVVRIRGDVSWEDVIRNSQSEERHLGESSKFKSVARGYWTEKNMREHMIKFAVGHQLDPLRSKTWYHSRDEFCQTKSGKIIVNKFKGGYFQAVRHLFPELKLNPSLFRQRWDKVENRRKLLEEYAEENGFDPLLPDEWYLQPRERILDKKGALAVIMYHKRSVSQAIIDLFPNIGLVKSKFKAKALWSYEGNRHKFFEKYAKQNNFDPLIPSNWYIQSRHDVMAVRDAQDVLYYHKNSLSRALCDLFPEIGLQKSQFYLNSLYKEKEARKEFFKHFAKSNGFDPLVASNWHSQYRDDIMSFKGAHGVMSHYNNSISKALLDVFPSIGLKESQLKAHKSAWNSVLNRRKFFEEYAKKHNFDPLSAEDWYLQSRESFLNAGARAIIIHHNLSVPDALVDLFPEVKFDKSKLNSKNLWHSAEKRRNFFEKYAKDENFDPLVAENWHSRSLQSLMLTKGIHSVINYHNSSVAKALFDLFPEIGLQKSKLLVAKSFWHDINNRRKFFEDYAEAHHFDPLLPSHWYSLPLYQILSVKGAKGVIVYHDGSVVRALMDLFPNIGFDRKLLQAALVVRQQLLV